MKKNKIYIKNKNMFRNKYQMIIYILLFILIIYAFIYIGKQNYNTKLPDNETFAKEFNKVPLTNVYNYATAGEVKALINNGTGIVLFGTNNEWVNYYAEIVNTAAKESKIEKIVYYDFLKNRQDNNGTYEYIVNKLSKYCYVNDRGKKEIYAPSLLVMKNGKVLYFDSETSFVHGSDIASSYWNMYKRSEKIFEIKEVFSKYMEVQENGK